MYPTDNYGNICGVDNSATVFPTSGGGTRNGDNLKDRPFLFYPDPTDLTNFFCVDSCPNEIDCLSEDNVRCEYGEEFDGTPVVGTAGPCYCGYQSDSILNRCAPIGDSISTDISDSISDATSSRSVLQVLAGDLASTWQYVLICMGVAVVLSFSWVSIMRKYTSCMAWTTVFGLFITMCAGTYWIYDSAIEKTAEAAAQDPVVESQVSNAQTMTYFSYAMMGMCVLSFLLILFMRKRVKIAIGVIREAGKAIGDMPMMMFFPLVTFTGLMVFFTYWVGVSCYLASAGDPVVQSDGTIEYEADKTLQSAMFYHLMGMFWTSQFILAVGMTTIAGATATWYWTADKANLPKSPVRKAFGNVLRYHAGSLALGSFIIASIKMIRFCLKYSEKQLKKSNNIVARKILLWLNCCFAIVEKVLKFLNRNAYIEIAVYGYSFCKAAKRAFELITRNVLRVAAVNLIGDFLLFVGKCMIATMTGVVCAVFLRYVDDLSYYMTICWMTTMFAYFIAQSFMDTYEMAIDTILMCFCEDCERNDGSQSKPYYMSEELRDSIDAAPKPIVGDQAAQ